MRQLSAIFISISLLLLGACESVGTKKEYKLDAEFKSYFLFNDGSTWKYTLASDSSVVENVKCEAMKSGQMYWEDMIQDFFTYNLKSDRDSLMIVRTVATTNEVARWALLRQDTIYKQIAELFYTSSKLTGVTGNKDSVHYHGSISVRDVVYNDVVELISNRKMYVSRLYFAKNIGIIRKDLTDGRVFLLSEYNLN